jgi:16S rRNA (cytidine1402-2'-O)-methyltransferase
VKLLVQLIDGGFATHNVVVCRELSKIHEEFIRGTVTEVHEELTSRVKIRGEIVVILDPIQRDA